MTTPADKRTITVTDNWGDDVQVTREKFTERWVNSIKDIGLLRIMTHAWNTDLGKIDLNKKEDFELWVEDMAGREWDHVLQEQASGD
tara:strand:+ start:2743 stop:3003 length:261 start_codon:yes stop_codon:yes gene_type:complete